MAKTQTYASVGMEKIKTYTNFDSVEDVVSNITQTVTEAMWAGDVGTMTNFYTSSAQAISNYYLNIYDQDPSSEDDATVQFAVSFGDYQGRGGAVVSSEANDNTFTPTLSIYSQYRNLLLSPTETVFTINGESYNSIYVINIQRAQLKEKIDPGNWELTIQTASGSYSFIDNNSSISRSTNSSGEYYNIVSGSIANGIYTSGGSQIVVGRIYTQYGILLFGADQLNSGSGLITDLSVNSDQDNHMTFYNAIVSGSSFKARNNQTVKSTYYFVRVKNSEYNYTNNPSYYIQDTNEFRHDEMITDPQTYITTVGLYNDKNDLLAVAKISQPLLKNAQREALIKVKLDW